jgi:glycerol-1-phosphate dehydrogenase [NAD(P)+]
MSFPSRFLQGIKGAHQTREVMFDSGVLPLVPSVLRGQFGATARGLIVADPNTMEAAGDTIAEAMPDWKQFVFRDPSLYAEHTYVEQLEAELRKTDAIPIAVGTQI